ncbi:MAG: hypothetical protein ACOZQL_43025 [Myxococcota bacterium]
MHTAAVALFWLLEVAAAPPGKALAFPSVEGDTSPIRLDALYRYPIDAPLPEAWQVKVADRRTLVAALLVYAPQTSRFARVSLSDDAGNRWASMSPIFVDGVDQELGLRSGVLDPRATRVVRFFEVPDTVERVVVTAGERALAPTKIAATGPAWRAKLEESFAVQATGWLTPQRNGQRLYAALVTLRNFHRLYRGDDLAISDSKHSRLSKYVQAEPKVMLEVDERLRVHELPRTPAVVSERTLLVVYEVPPEWETPDWLLGAEPPAAGALEERLPPDTKQRITRLVR